jgi:hypothetical protein
MSRYLIRNCTLADLRELARTMRAEDRAEIEGMGCVVRHFLFRLYRASFEPRVAIVDGEVAAAWGDHAGLLGDEGLMWAFTAPPVARLPLAFFRESRREVADRLKIRRSLITDVADGYKAAQRFFRLVGFQIDEPVNGYRRMTIRRAA